MNRPQVDSALLQWDGVFNRRQTRRVHTPELGTLPEGANAVRRRLGALVRRTPQAMVRISGGGRGMRAIRAHLDYISRHGRLALTGADGELYRGAQELAWLAYEWQSSGVPIAERSGRREALNIVLSMPAGTEPAALLAAARDFAQDEFAGHQYALVLHCHEDDPGRAPSPHPHVHLCVKKSADDGTRLNPRKPDLRRWRERFAERLREHGIDAAASGRLERFERQPRCRQGAHHLRQRGAMGGATPSISTQPLPQPAQYEVPLLRRYAAVARLLAGSADAADRSLALGLVKLCGKVLERDRAPARAR